MKPVVSNIVSGLASMSVSTVVVNVVKNNTPKNPNLYSKLMVGLGTFVLSSVLADICAEKLVDMIDDAVPAKPLGPIRFNHSTDAVPIRTAHIQHGAELIQRYVDEFMVTSNPDLPSSVVLTELIRNFCLDNHLDINHYEFGHLTGDISERLIEVLATNGP